MLEKSIERKDEPQEYNFALLMKIKSVLINMIIMNLAWSASSFGYYMVGFYLKYVPGDLYTNVIVS